MNVPILQGNHSSLPSAQNLGERLIPVLLLGLMVPFVFGVSAPALAQSESYVSQPDTTMPDRKAASSLSIASPTWNANFGVQAATLLKNDFSASVRETVLHDIIAVAIQSPDAVDLSATVDPLLEIIEEDPDEERRLMALQALQVIGTDHTHGQDYVRAMKRLYQIMDDEPCKRLRGAAAQLLAVHESVDSSDATLRGQGT